MGAAQPHAAGEAAQEAAGVGIVAEQPLPADHHRVDRPDAAGRRGDGVAQREGRFLERHGEIETAHAETAGLGERLLERRRRHPVAEVQMGQAGGGKCRILHGR